MKVGYYLIPCSAENSCLGDSICPVQGKEHFYLLISIILAAFYVV